MESGVGGAGEGVTCEAAVQVSEEEVEEDKTVFKTSIGMVM